MSTGVSRAKQELLNYLYITYKLEKRHLKKATKDFLLNPQIDKASVQKFSDACRVNKEYITSDRANIATRSSRVDTLAKLILGDSPHRAGLPQQQRRELTPSALSAFERPKAAFVDDDALSYVSGSSADIDRTPTSSPEPRPVIFPTVGSSPSEMHRDANPKVKLDLRSIKKSDPNDFSKDGLWLLSGIAVAAFAVGLNYYAPGLNGRICELLKDKFNLFS